MLKDSGIDGGIIVTTPSEVAILDVQRQIKFCQMVGLPIIGVIENMAGFSCPKCDVTSPIFKPSQIGRVKELCEKNGLKLLGSLPIDPKICKAMDLGTLIKYLNIGKPKTLFIEAIPKVGAKVGKLGDIPVFLNALFYRGKAKILWKWKASA